MQTNNMIISLDKYKATSGDNLDFSLLGYNSKQQTEVKTQLEESIILSSELYNNFDPSKTSNIFRDAKIVYLPAVDTSSMTNTERLCYGCKFLRYVPLLDTSNVTNMQYMFYYCSSLTSIPLLDTSNVTNMQNMFDGCSSLTSIPQLDTSNVTIMSNVFSGCSSLTSIPQLDTSKVTNMNSMFSSCTSLTTINGIDFSSLSSAPNYFIGYSSSLVYLYKFIVNGKIDFSWTNSQFSASEKMTTESVLSMLNAMNNTTNSNAKTMAFKFNRLKYDERYDNMLNLISECTSKNWTITGINFVESELRKVSNADFASLTPEENVIYEISGNVIAVIKNSVPIYAGEAFNNLELIINDGSISRDNYQMQYTAAGKPPVFGLFISLLLKPNSDNNDFNIKNITMNDSSENNEWFENNRNIEVGDNVTIRIYGKKKESNGGYRTFYTKNDCYTKKESYYVSGTTVKLNNKNFDIYPHLVNIEKHN